MLIPLTLNKTVTLDNYRLRLCFNVVMLMFLGICIAFSVSTQAWTKTQEITAVRVSLWTPTHLNVTDLEQLYHRKASEGVCVESRRFAYKKDENLNWVRTVHGCLPVCGSQRSSTCAMRGELEQTTQETVTFVTAIEDTVVHPNKNIDHRSYFTPYEEAYRFFLSYAYEYRIPGSWNNFWRTERLIGSSTSTLSILVTHDKNGKEKPIRRFTPDDAGIELSLLELLRLTFQAQRLDEPQPQLGRNRLPNASIPHGPVGRVTGFQVLLKLTCYARGTHGFDWDGTVCTIFPLRSPSLWVSRTSTSSRGNTKKFRRYRGVEIIVKSRMHESRFDFKTLLSWISSTYVVLRLPMFLFRLVIGKYLGSLSSIYSATFQEKFDLPSHLCSLAIDIMSRNAIFHLLAGSQAGISLALMMGKITESLQGFCELDYSEINAFVLFFFAMAYDSQKVHASQLQRTLTGKVGALVNRKSKSQAVYDRLQHRSLGITKFIRASTMGKTIIVENVVRLFDQDRKLGVVERFFMPDFMRYHVMKMRRDPNQEETRASLACISLSNVSTSQNSPDEASYKGGLQNYNEMCKTLATLETEMHACQQQLDVLKEDFRKRCQEFEGHMRQASQLTHQRAHDLSADPCAADADSIIMCTPQPIPDEAGNTCLPKEETSLDQLLQTVQQSVEDICSAHKVELQVVLQQHLTSLSEALTQHLQTTEKHSQEINSVSTRLSKIECHQSLTHHQKFPDSPEVHCREEGPACRSYSDWHFMNAPKIPFVEIKQPSPTNSCPPSPKFVPPSPHSISTIFPSPATSTGTLRSTAKGTPEEWPRRTDQNTTTSARHINFTRVMQSETIVRWINSSNQDHIRNSNRASLPSTGAVTAKRTTQKRVPRTSRHVMCNF